MNYQELVQTVEARARKNCPRIVFPEARDPKILEVAVQIQDGGFAQPILIGRREEVLAAAEEAGIAPEALNIVDHTDEDLRQKYAQLFVDETPEYSLKMILRKIRDPLYFGSCMVRFGDADGTIAGFLYSTADVILAYSTIYGKSSPSGVVSGFSLVCIPGFDGPTGEVFALSDASVTVDPTAEQLAEIAINAADASKAIVGWDPKVALLSYSTKGSGQSASVEKVLQALEIVHRERPDIDIDGELQLDTALSASAAVKKLGDDTNVAGRANVIIFPNLDAGNIAVKAMKLFSHARIMGPLLNGFNFPGSDLSRTSPPDQLLGAVKLLAALCGGRETQE